jgi:hypothetical protein
VVPDICGTPTSLRPTPLKHCLASFKQYTQIHQVLDMTGAALVTDVGVGALAACSELRQLTLSW